MSVESEFLRFAAVQAKLLDQNHPYRRYKQLPDHYLALLVYTHSSIVLPRSYRFCILAGQSDPECNYQIDCFIVVLPIVVLRVLMKITCRQSIIIPLWLLTLSRQLRFTDTK